jgi:hypothetical protein
MNYLFGNGQAINWQQNDNMNATDKVIICLGIDR